MAAPQPLTGGARLRRAAELLLDCADRMDTPQRSLVRVQQLHDDIETAAGDARAVVRGRP